MTKINACPFCGSQPTLVVEIDLERWAVNCEQCGAIGPTACSQFEAVRLWVVADADSERPAKLGVG